MKELIIIIDTETTAKEGSECIELGYITIDYPSLTITEEFVQRYKPIGEIALGALAVHHIHPDDLVDCPSVTTLVKPEASYYIGHNIDFDLGILGITEGKFIDTLALARYFMSELDSHTQSALLYHIKGKSAREILKEAHSALADVKICWTILEYIHGYYLEEPEKSSLEALYQLSEVARVPVNMPFGKHFGEPIQGIPASYKSWLLKQPDLDKYLVKALRISNHG